MKPIAGDALCAQTLTSLLRDTDPAIALEVHDTGASSNAALLDGPPAAPGGLRALAIENQTAGRGRRGRGWLSFGAGSLAFSVRWERDPRAAPPLGLSLAAGVAIAETLDRFGARNVQLKWPNDLLRDGIKAGGILVEMTRAADAQAVVIGVGVNLILPPALDAPFPVAALFEPAEAPSRNALLAALLAALDAMRRQFDAHGFAPFQSRWNARNAHANRAVVLSGEGQGVEGRHCGVDADGALLIDTASGRVRVLSGDLSLRAMT